MRQKVQERQANPRLYMCFWEVFCLSWNYQPLVKIHSAETMGAKGLDEKHLKRCSASLVIKERQIHMRRSSFLTTMPMATS